MARRRIDEAARAMEGTVIAGDATRSFAGAAIDSRRVRGGELFFALPGARTDGHRFVGDALARGAAGAVIDRDPAEVDLGPAGRAGPAGAALIRVANTYRALHALTRAVRAQVPRQLVGITGSTGKTTTKELLAAMLGRRFAVARSPGNLNNRLGFPLALLGIADGTDWMVAEMGMSEPGELAEVSRLARPDAALLLNVRPAHLEQLGSLAAIAEAKAEILEGLSPEGLLVANADDPEVARIARRHRGRTVWFGFGEGAEVRASGAEPLPAGEVGSRFTLESRGERREIRLPLHGLYNVENCLAAAAAALALGVSLDEVAAAAAAAEPAAGRGVVHRLAGGITVIDDSYNSNPSALERALASAAQLAAPAPAPPGPPREPTPASAAQLAATAQRRWAVLGDMLELGPEAPRFHREGGQQAAALGFSPVAGVGELARDLAAGAGEAGAAARWFADARAAAEWAAAELRPGDLVLVKGSRGVGLEAVVARLLAAAGGGPAAGGRA